MARHRALLENNDPIKRLQNELSKFSQREKNYSTIRNYESIRRLAIIRCMDRDEIIKETENWIINQGYRIGEIDKQRPWGAFWHIHRADTQNFLQQFFPEQINLTINDISPKILLVLPHQKLSLQVHKLRSESWVIIQGPVSTVLGSHQQIYNLSDKITIPCHTQHRLIGLNQPGIVAEIWIHQDQQKPSDEYDIIRIEDDYHRK